MIPVLPDSEALALTVLRNYLDGQADFGVAPPADWNKALPFVVVTKVGGKPTDPHVEHSILSVSVIASTRRAASDLSRLIYTTFFRAVREGFNCDEGVISRFEAIKTPLPVRDGLSGKHPDSFMFDATYDIWSRAPYTSPFVDRS